ncbi:MAG: hypothetical protein CVT95_12030, partial [Bacteroidetes bacterium HGW-Bacteroidetes-12]
MSKHTFIILLLLFISKLSFSQLSVKDSSVAAPMFQISYSVQLPGGDLADRFGFSSGVKFSFIHKTPSNWLFGAEFTYIFGNQIKNKHNILSNIYTSDTTIIDGNGSYAEVYFYERGYNIGFMGGKLFPIWGPNKNSGITIMAGPCFLQHKIRIENPENVAYQIKDDYKKGYDQLTNGIGINEFIGYTYLGNNRIISFVFGFEFTQVFTKCRRDYDFVT